MTENKPSLEVKVVKGKKANASPTSTSLIITVIIVIVFIGGCAACGACSSEEDKKDNQQESETTSEDEESVEAEPQEKVVKETTADKLKAAAVDLFSGEEDFSTSFDKKSKTAMLVYTEVDFWDESSLVRGAYSKLVKFGIEAFDISGVGSVQVKCKTEFTDAYGKKSTEEAVILAMSKKEFAKFDWESLGYQSIYKQMMASCSKHYIHPAVLKNLNYDKLYLSI